MIRNNLAVMLAVRNLKITKVSNDTGISRTTLTSLSKNDNQGIQMDTINKLCQYLKVTPAEFFEYIPLDIDFSLFYEEDEDGYGLFEPERWEESFEMYMNVNDPFHETKSFLFKGVVYHEKIFIPKVHVFLENRSEKDDVFNIIKNLPSTFMADIEWKMKEIIADKVEGVSLITTNFIIDWLGLEE